MTSFAPVLKPLHINTNIVYDLDKSKFPGLEDPSFVNEPALVISSPSTLHNWLMAVRELRDENMSDKDVDSNVSYISCQPAVNTPEEDLYTLIESCNLTPSCAMTNCTFESFIDRSSIDQVQYTKQDNNPSCDGCNDCSGEPNISFTHRPFNQIGFEYKPILHSPYESQAPLREDTRDFEINDWINFVNEYWDDRGSFGATNCGKDRCKGDNRREP